MRLGCLDSGEADLAILATKEAGLDLKLFAVDASFDPQGQFNKIAKIEEKYVMQICPWKFEAYW